MLESICNMGVELTGSEADYEVVRLANGDWEAAQYRIGTRFERTDFACSDRGIIVIDGDGDKIYIPAGEYQCFREVDS